MSLHEPRSSTHVLSSEFLFRVEIPCFAAGIPGSFREQGIYANPLILPCDQACGPPKTGKSGAIFEDSLLNSLGCTPVVRHGKWEQFGRHVRYAGG